MCASTDGGGWGGGGPDLLRMCLIDGCAGSPRILGQTVCFPSGLSDGTGFAVPHSRALRCERYLMRIQFVRALPLLMFAALVLRNVRGKNARSVSVPVTASSRDLSVCVGSTLAVRANVLRDRHCRISRPRTLVRTGGEIFTELNLQILYVSTSHSITITAQHFAVEAVVPTSASLEQCPSANYDVYYRFQHLGGSQMQQQGNVHLISHSKTNYVQHKRSLHPSPPSSTRSSFRSVALWQAGSL